MFCRGNSIVPEHFPVFDVNEINDKAGSLVSASELATFGVPGQAEVGRVKTVESEMIPVHGITRITNQFDGVIKCRFCILVSHHGCW
jgi:hypothetical protein